jgi:hypothetical protein
MAEAGYKKLAVGAQAERLAVKRPVVRNQRVLRINIPITPVSYLSIRGF